MLFNKGLQTLWLGGAAGKVKLVQGFNDPGIDGEGFGEAVGKQQDAIGNLGCAKYFKNELICLPSKDNTPSWS